MKIVVDRDLCEGNAVCVGIAPEVFQLGDDDVVRILIENPDASLRPKLEEAVRNCPRQALKLVDD